MGGQFSGGGAVFLGGGQFSRGQFFSGGQFSRGQISRGTFPGGTFPRTPQTQPSLRSNHSALQHLFFSKTYCIHCVVVAQWKTKHYLLECNRFNNLRVLFMDTFFQIYQLTLRTLLFSNTKLSDTENQQIFLAVQDIFLKSNGSLDWFEFTK